MSFTKTTELLLQKKGTVFNKRDYNRRDSGRATGRETISAVRASVPDEEKFRAGINFEEGHTFSRRGIKSLGKEGEWESVMQNFGWHLSRDAAI